MITMKRGFIVGIMGFLFLILPGTGWTQEPLDEGSQAVIEVLKDQNSKLSRELRRIQREIAALRADLDKPGIKEVAAGVGYIFGLFGVAAYVASRRKE
jgi:nickel transport protein